MELLRSGCASVADHNYLYWPDMPFDTSEIVFSEGEALGMRIVLCRGGATQGRAVEQDLPVALRPETFDSYMADVERLVSRYHDPRPESLRRVVMAPTTVLHLRAGRPAAGDGEAGPPAEDPAAQPFIGNRRLSRCRAAEILHDAGSVLCGTRLAGK